jgi:hypothetical protein
MAHLLDSFRRGLRRPADDSLFGLAFQGSAVETYLLHEEGLVLKDETVTLTDGTLGRKLTPKGRALGSQMRS